MGADTILERGIHLELETSEKELWLVTFCLWRCLPIGEGLGPLQKSMNNKQEKEKENTQYLRKISLSFHIQSTMYEFVFVDIFTDSM